MSKTLKELATLIQGTVIGNPDTVISGITSIEEPRPGQLAYITNPRQLSEAEASSLAALIVPKQIQKSKKPIIQSEHPKLAWAVLLGLFNPPRIYPKTISEQASISKSAKIGKDVTLEPFVFIGGGVEIGDRSVIRSYSYIDEQTKIGSDTIIHPHTVLYPNAQIGTGSPFTQDL